jgi:hypothetical protein
VSRRFRVLYADKAQGRTYRVRSYVVAESADAARAIFSSVKVLSVREVK